MFTMDNISSVTVEWPIAAADENGDILQSDLVFQELTGRCTNVWELMDVDATQRSEAFVHLQKGLVVVDTNGNNVNVWATLEQKEAEGKEKWWLLELKVEDAWSPTWDAAAAAVATVMLKEPNYPPPKVGSKTSTER